MTTQPNSGEEKAEQLYVIVKRGLYYRPGGKGYTSCLCEAWKLPYEEAKKHEMYADNPKVPNCEKVLIEPAPPDELSQLRAERDKAFDVNKTMGDAIERLARRFGTTSEDAAFVVEVVFGAFADLTAERDRLKEDYEGRKATEEASVAECNRLTAELEAAEASAKSWMETCATLEKGHEEIESKFNNAIAQRDAKVRELRKYARHYATCDKLAFALSECSCGLDALLSTPPNEGEKETPEEIRIRHKKDERANAGRYGMPQGPCQCVVCNPPPNPEGAGEKRHKAHPTEVSRQEFDDIMAGKKRNTDEFMARQGIPRPDDTQGGEK